MREAESVEAFLAEVGERKRALGITDEMIARAEWRGASNRTQA